MSPAPVPRGKTILLLGASRSGKTSFIRHYMYGTFSSKYRPTNLPEITTIPFDSTIGTISLTVHDCPDKKQDFSFGPFDGICLFLDLTEADPQVKVWYSLIQTLRIKRQTPFPVVICGNKCDSFDRKIHTDILAFASDRKIPYCEVSALTLFNFLKPFELLCRSMFSRPDLCLSHSPLLYPSLLQEKEEDPKSMPLISIAPSRCYYPDLSICQSIDDSLFVLEI